MVGAQGQVIVAKKSSTYDITHKKSAPPSKNFFSSANYKTCRLYFHFNQVCNANWSGDIPAQSMCNPAVFLRTAWINPDVKVLILLNLEKDLAPEQLLRNKGPHGWIN